VDASLTSIDTLPVCATCATGTLPPALEPPPPPHAATSAAAMPTGNNRIVLRTMFNVSSFNDNHPKAQIESIVASLLPAPTVDYCPR
jgi:hypothetical protein